jgi:hypothetical protein
MFDLPPGAERTVQYADFLGPFDVDQGKPRVSFLLVTIPSEVARGVVARTVAALSKGPFDGALAELPETPVGRALEHVAQQLLDSLESTTPVSAHGSSELRPGKPASAHGSQWATAGKEPPR